MYSRRLQTLEYQNTEAALRALLRQLNVVQEETERELIKRNMEMRAELTALKDRVKTLEEGK